MAAAERLARRAAELAEQADAPSARSVAAYTLGEALADSDPDAALRAFDVALDQAASIRARFLEGIARTADVALRGRHGDPAEALARYRAALQVWHRAGADGLVLTTLRNLVVLLVRIGSDAAALTLHTAIARLGTRDAYGAGARRLDTAPAAAIERPGAPAVEAARHAAAELTGLAQATGFAIAAIEDAVRS